MRYNFDDKEAEVPDLDVFKEQLAIQMLKCSFFQGVIKADINMLKLPNIMAPKLVLKQINTDTEKQTLFNQDVNYGSETMTELAKLISKRRIDILNLDSLSSNEVRSISKALHIKKVARKSNVRLLEEINFICKMYAAGQGNLRRHICETCIQLVYKFCQMYAAGRHKLV